jgi:glutamine phosphoribosylpyrophosphate amidotransferase
MCGILGIVGHNDVAAQLYDGLTVLQHRGQDAAGIATANGSKLRVHKGNGLVSEVFDAKAPAAKARTRRSPSTSTRRSASRWRTTAT